jgi:CBS domain containing-hemolysin-like protein
MIIIISLILSAFFSGMEIAYVSSDKLNLEIQKKQVGIISNILTIITKEPSKFISTMLIGNNFALVVYGFFMGDFIFNNLLINKINEMNELSLVLIQTSISTVIILITAEFIPKVIFQIYSNFFIRIFAVPAYIFYIIFSPLTNTVTLISDFILNKFFNTNTNETRLSFTKIELENYIESEIQHSSEDIDTEIEIFQNALELSEIKARDIMVPRTEITAIDLKMHIEEVKKIFIDTGFSKLPVYKKSIDNIIGYVHSFDFLKQPRDIKSFLLPVEFIPEPMFVDEVLQVLTRQRKSLAIVIDEYGGASGILTIEDIVEELFGEIEDEHDNVEYFENNINKDTIEVSARLEVEYINNKYKMTLPLSDSYETLGGLIFNKTEYIPNEEEEIIINEYKITIKEATSSKVEKILITKNLKEE